MARKGRRWILRYNLRRGNYLKMINPMGVELTDRPSEAQTYADKGEAILQARRLGLHWRAVPKLVVL